MSEPGKRIPEELDAAAAEVLDEYLDELLLRLHGEPRTARRLLAEAEDHLLTATRAGIAAGVDPASAARAATASFGSPGVIAAAHARTTPLRWITDALMRSVSLVVLLAAAALMAIGLASGVAVVGAIAAGPGFIAGAAPSAGASAADCARWLALYPGAGDCAAAAAQDAIHDVVMSGGVAGVLGGVLLVGYLILHATWFGRRARAGLALGHRHAVGLTLFVTAAAVLLLNAVHNLHLVANSIPGASLSLGIGAAIVAAGFAVRLLRGPRPPMAAAGPR